MAPRQPPPPSLKPPQPPSPTPSSNPNLHLYKTLRTKALQGEVSHRNTVNSSRVSCSNSNSTVHCSSSKQLQCNGLRLTT